MFETSITSITISENTEDEMKLCIQNWAKSLKFDAVI